MPALIERMKGMPQIARQAMMSAYGVSESMIASHEKMSKKAEEAHMSLDDYMKKKTAESKEQEKLDSAFNEAMDTTVRNLQQLLLPALKMIMSIMAPIISAFTFLLAAVEFLTTPLRMLFSVIADLGVAGDIIKGILGVALVAGLLVATGAATRLATGFSRLATTARDTAKAVSSIARGMWDFAKAVLPGGEGVTKWYQNLRKTNKAAEAGTKATENLNKSNKALNQGTKSGGSGLVQFFRNLKRALLVFARSSGKILQGAATFALALTLMLLPMLLFIGVIGAMGISTDQLLVIAGIMLAAMIVMTVALHVAAGAGAVAAGAMPLLIAFAIAMVIIGAAFILAAVAFNIFASAALKLKDVDLMAIAVAMVVMGAAMVIFAVAALGFAAAIWLLAGSVPALIVFAGLFLAAVVAMMVAMFLFPTTDFTNMANAMATFSEALQGLPDVGSSLGKIRAVMDALDELEDYGIGALWSMYAGMELMHSIGDKFAPAADPMASFADSLQKIASIDSHKSLADGVISKEADFVRAAEIIGTYAGNVSESLSTMHEHLDGAADKMVDLAQASMFAGIVGSLFPSTVPTTQTAGVDTVVEKEGDAETIGILKAQLAELKRIDTDGKENKTAVAEILRRIDLLTEAVGYRPLSGDASQNWT
jgi:hypothetical protein